MAAEAPAIPANEREAVVQDILKEVIPGDSEEDVRFRQYVLNETSGLSLQTVSKLPQSFWSAAAKKNLKAPAGATEDAKELIERQRLVFESAGAALTAQVLSYVDAAAERMKREIQLAKLPEADVSGLVAKVSTRHQIKFTPALIPPASVVAKCRANKFVELSECRVSDSEYSTTRSELATSVSGAQVEVLKRGTEGNSKFLLSGDVTVCLLRLMMAMWLVAPEQGNFLVFHNYVLRVAEMGNHGWGRALRLDRRHRESIITRMAADNSLTIYDMFEDDVVTANFARASLEYDNNNNGKEKKRDNTGKGSLSRKRGKKSGSWWGYDWNSEKSNTNGGKPDKSSKSKIDEEKR